MTAAYNVVMDVSPKPRRRLWPAVVAALGAGAIATALVGAASNDGPRDGTGPTPAAAASPLSP